MNLPLGFEPRPTCPRCQRPRSVCYCAHLAELPTRTRVVFLQHPREESLGIGTARMASLCLPGSELYVGLRWSGSSALASILLDPERPPALLFPGPSALDVSDSPPPGPITLVVVDGTWSQAKKIVKETPELAALPRYTFVPPTPSRYRIRREPQEDFLSTIESLAHVLGVLEGDPERFRALHAPFQAMVETQLAFAKNSTTPRHRRRPRPPPSAPRPAPIFRERFHDLVCVVTEANAWSFRSGQRSKSDPGDLVQCLAFRPLTGERLEVIVAPLLPLSPDTAPLIELPAELIRAGVSRAAFRDAWRSFLRPNDVMVAWGTHPPSLLRAAEASLPEFLDLRRQARIFLNRRVGPIEAFLNMLGVSPSVEGWGPGRGGRRLGMLVEAVRTLKSL